MGSDQHPLQGVSDFDLKKPTPAFLVDMAPWYSRRATELVFVHQKLLVFIEKYQRRLK